MRSLPDDTRAWIATSPDTTDRGWHYQRDDDEQPAPSTRPHLGFSITSPGRARLARGGAR